MIEQDLKTSKYPNSLSYYLTQFGIVFSNEIFYANLFYEILAFQKDLVQVEPILYDYGMDEIPRKVDLSKFPHHPDSMVKYIYKLKLTILIKTIVTMLVLSGFCNFFSTFMRKIYYYSKQK